MAKADYYTVRESFIGPFGEYHKGEVVTADDPAFEKMPSHFEALVIRGQVRGEVEQATAAPGEKRHLGRYKKAVKPEAKAAEPEPEPEPEPELPQGKAMTLAGMKGQ